MSLVPADLAQAVKGLGRSTERTVEEKRALVERLLAAWIEYGNIWLSDLIQSAITPMGSGSISYIGDHELVESVEYYATKVCSDCHRTRVQFGGECKRLTGADGLIECLRVTNKRLQAELGAHQ